MVMGRQSGNLFGSRGGDVFRIYFLEIGAATGGGGNAPTWMRGMIRSNALDFSLCTAIDYLIYSLI
jgi:hypothetical protein